jgi:hypothetical protein
MMDLPQEKLAFNNSSIDNALQAPRDELFRPIYIAVRGQPEKKRALDCVPFFRGKRPLEPVNR